MLKTLPDGFQTIWGYWNLLKMVEVVFNIAESLPVCLRSFETYVKLNLTAWRLILIWCLFWFRYRLSLQKSSVWNSWFPAGDTIWGVLATLRGGALLKNVSQWGGMFLVSKSCLRLFSGSSVLYPVRASTTVKFYLSHRPGFNGTKYNEQKPQNCEPTISFLPSSCSC